MATVLLVSDQGNLIERVRGLGETLGTIVVHVSGQLEEVGTIVNREEVHAVLIDLACARDDDTTRNVVDGLAAAQQSCPVVVLTDAYQDAQAISFLRAGAADYLSPSQDFAKLALLLEVLASRSHPKQTPAAWPAVTDAQRDPFYHVLVPEHPEMIEQARRVASQSVALLFTGETGTGKTRLARLVHDLSPRREQPFQVVECAALSVNLVESELFGEAPGRLACADGGRRGKLAAAAGGTLLLDEVGALPPPLQTKLLRVFDERAFEPIGSSQPLPFTARIMAATSVPLDQEVLAGRFRAELYYRLNVVGFFLLPLREQPDAIAPLCRKLLDDVAGPNGPCPTWVAPAAVRALQAYHWPGNIRELRNVLERAAALARGPAITLQDLPERIARCPEAEPPLNHLPQPDRPAANGIHARTLQQAKEELEIETIRSALRKHRNNRLRAALELGISRMGFYKKLHKYGLLDVNEA
jgi:DNA-binding NtrC family response regulator